MGYRNKLVHEENKKASKLVFFILDQIFSLDPKMFPVLSTYLGYDASSKQDDEEMKDESQPLDQKKE